MGYGIHAKARLHRNPTFALVIVFVFGLSIPCPATAPLPTIREPNKIFGIGTVGALAWSPDGTKYAVGTSNFIKIFKTSTNETLLTILDRNPSGDVLKEPQIHSLAFSHDGKLLASGNNRGEARIWDAATGAIKRTLTVKTSDTTDGIVNGVDFTFDNKYLATGLGYAQWGTPLTSGSLKLWDASTGALKRTYKYLDNISAVACSPTEMKIATIDIYGITRLWNNSQNAPALSFECDFYNSFGRDVAFSADGTLVAAAIEGSNYVDFKSHKGVVLWNSGSAAAVHTYFDDTDGVSCVAFTKNGLCLATGSYGKVKRWNTASGYGMQKTYTVEGTAAQLAFSPDAASTQLLVGANGWGGEVRLLNTSTGNRIRTVHGHNRGVVSLAVMPGGKQFLSGADTYGTEQDLESAQAKMVEIATGKELFLMSGSGGSTIVGAAPDGQHIMTATFGNGLKVWNSAGGFIKEVKERDSENKLVAVSSASAAFAAGGTRIVSGVTRVTGYNKSEGAVSIFDWSKGIKEREIRPLDDDFTALGIYDGKLGTQLVAGTSIKGSSYSGKAYRYGLDGTLSASPVAYNGSIYSTAISPTGQQMAIGGTAGVWLWDLKTNKLLFNLPSQGFCVAFSPDGAYLAAGDGWSAGNDGNGGYGRVQVWGTATGKAIKYFLGQKATVKSLAYTPDGTQLLSGSLDGSVFLWGGLPRSKNAAGLGWIGYE